MDSDKLYAPVTKLSDEAVAKVPACLYETGWLKEGEDVYPCPRCDFLFNSLASPPKCANCGLQATSTNYAFAEPLPDQPLFGCSPLLLLPPAPDA